MPVAQAQEAQASTTHGPVEVVRFGRVAASIFARTVKVKGRDVVLHSVALDKRYQDKQTGETKYTSNFGLNDLPLAMSALQGACQYILDHQTEQSAEEESE